MQCFHAPHLVIFRYAIKFNYFFHILAVLRIQIYTFPGSCNFCEYKSATLVIKSVICIPESFFWVRKFVLSNKTGIRPSKLLHENMENTNRRNFLKAGALLGTTLAAHTAIGAIRSPRNEENGK